MELDLDLETLLWIARERPALLAPLALAAAVTYLESWGQKHGAPWSYDFGIPLGRVVETYDFEVPQPIPDSWLEEYEVVANRGSRITYRALDGEGNKTSSFAVLVIRLRRKPDGGVQTEFRLTKQAALSRLAWAAAFGSMASLGGLGVAAGAAIAAITLAYFSFTAWRNAAQLETTFHLMTADIMRRAKRD